MKDFCKEHPCATVLIVWSILGTIQYCAYAISKACGANNVDNPKVI